MKTLLLLSAILMANISLAQSLVINEVSQGPAGSEEYVEFLVVPDPSQIISCTEILPCLDLRGWIFDDNNGYFSGGADVYLTPVCECPLMYLLYNKINWLI